MNIRGVARIDFESKVEDIFFKKRKSRNVENGVSKVAGFFFEE